MRTHSVISNAGPRSLHDVSSTCKCALAAPSYRHKHAYLRVHVFRATLRSLRCAFLPSTCRQRSCLCLLLAPTCIVVCPVSFALATLLRNYPLSLSPIFSASLGSAPLWRVAAFSGHSSLTGDCLHHGVLTAPKRRYMLVRVCPLHSMSSALLRPTLLG